MSGTYRSSLNSRACFSLRFCFVGEVSLRRWRQLGFSSFTFDFWLKVKRAEKALRRQDNCTSLCVTEKVLCKCEAVCKLGLCCLETFTKYESPTFKETTPLPHVLHN